MAVSQRCEEEAHGFRRGRNPTFCENLSARVTDSLCDEEIHFPPYDAKQLRKILSQRADDAFHDDVLQDVVIPLCAAPDRIEIRECAPSTEAPLQGR
ncbi:hypothetical protein [Halarchaeum grantii]|uniref:hypothetical protein n=1 Tax=Halarchaeum grantii TaxID=1193105 RepID=UPI003CCBA126